MQSTAPQTSSDHNEDLTVIVRKEVLQQVLDALQTIVDEAIFRIGHDGLTVSAVDAANVGMTGVDLDAEAFESVGEGKFPIGINLTRLDDYLDAANSDDLVQLAYAEETRRLNIQHTNVDVDMASIDPDSIRSEPDLPDIDWDAEFTVDADTFETGAEHADLVSDHTYITADPNEKEVRIVGDGDIDIIETAFDREDLIEASIDAEVTSIFSNVYLVGKRGQLGPVPSGAELSVWLDEEMPIRATYEIANGHGEIESYVAPRLTSE